jgi:MFS family permease
LHDPEFDREQTAASFSEAPEETPHGRMRPWASLTIPAYRLLVTSQMLGVVTQQMRQVINLWVVYQLSGSTIHLGILGALRVLPILVLALVAGSVADAVDRKKLLMIGQIVNGVFAAMLAALMLTGEIELWHIYAITLASTAATVFDQPARMALVSNLVPRTHLTNAITINSSTRHAAQLLGPSLGGIVIAISSPGTAYVVNALLTVPVLIALYRIRTPLIRGVRRRAPVGRAGMLEGLRFVFHTRIVLALMFIDIGLVSFTSYRVLMPVFAEDIFDVGASGLGLLMSAPAVGFLFGAALLLMLGEVQRKGLLVLLGGLAYVTSIFIFAISGWFVLSLIAIAAAGGSDGLGAIIRQTTLQLMVPDEIRGRATAVVQIGTRGASSIGFMATGVIAAWLGAPGALMLGAGIGVGVLLTALLMWRGMATSRV